MKSTLRNACALMMFCAVVIPQAARAGAREFVDFAPSTQNPDDSNYSFDGQFWYLDDDVSIPQPIFRTFIPLNFGSGAPPSRRFLLDPKGRINFVDTAGLPTGDYIAPLEGPVAFRIDPSFSPTSRINIAAGLLHPDILTGPPSSTANYDIDDALPAYRFNWQDVCTAISPCDGSGTNVITFQAVLVSLGPDAFLLSYNYGSNPFLPPGLSASFSLGSNARSFAGPYSDTGPDYCFSGAM